MVRALCLCVASYQVDLSKESPASYNSLSETSLVPDHIVGCAGEGEPQKAKVEVGQTQVRVKRGLRTS
jgi:hypothetical protein